MNRVVNLGAHRAAQTVAVLEDLLHRARTGTLHDFAFVAGLNSGPPLVGVTGSYRRDAVRALGALTLMQRRLCIYHERSAGVGETTMP